MKLVASGGGENLTLVIPKTKVGDSTNFSVHKHRDVAPFLFSF